MESMPQCFFSRPRRGLCQGARSWDSEEKAWREKSLCIRQSKVKEEGPMDYFRALVVDDEEDFLETLVNRLQKRNIDTAGARSGEEALEIMKKKLFDVVILDVKMPGGMDGIETLREMKKIQPLAEVLLLTGHASVETSIEGMKLGAFDYLLKPIKIEDLMTKMAEAFEKKNAHDQKIRKARIKELLRFPGRVLEHDKEDEKAS
jgi:DNA-binding NtrC family response regulator